MKVCIDAGHGGTDPGAEGTDPFPLEEKEITLAVALHLEEELESRGHWVIMTRRQDRSLSLGARASFANRLGAEVFLSVHANAALSPSVEGMEVFHFPGSDVGRQVARTLLRYLRSALPGHQNRGVKEANFAVLRLTDMPAALVETEFMTNPKQLRFLANDENRKRIAAALADAVDRLTLRSVAPAATAR